MTELYKKIENYFQFEKEGSVYTTLFKSILLLLSGGFMGQIFREINSEPMIFNAKTILILLGCISTYIYIEYRRLKKEKNFPVTILEHLTAVEELKILKEMHSRKSKLYEFIDNSIQSLNSNTCPVTLTPENVLCDQDLELGLKKVLIDLVERPHYMLNVDQTKFTIGAYINNLLDKKAPIGESETIENIYLFRDDLSLETYLPNSPYIINSEQEGSFQFQTATLEVLNFSKFICKPIDIENQRYTLVCSPIPNVCESCPPDGMIFSIYKGTEFCSKDFDSVLLIFGRILSNWIAKYNDCVRNEKKIKANETHQHSKIETPKEFLEFFGKKD